MRLINSTIQDQPTPHQTYTLQTKAGKRVELHQLSSKQIYCQLIDATGWVDQVKSPRWSETYSLKNPEFLTPTPQQWKDIYNSLYKRHHDGLAYDIRWRLLHFAHPTLCRLDEFRVIDYNECPRCTDHRPESHEYWFFFCKANQPAIQDLLDFLAALLPGRGPYTTDFDLFLYGFKAKGYQGDMEIAEILLDEYFCAVYNVRNRLVYHQEKVDLLPYLRQRMKLAVNWYYQKHPLP